MPPTGPSIYAHVAAHIPADGPGLTRFPGRGWPLVAAALASAITVSRNRAAAVIDACDRESMPPAAVPALQAVARAEPDGELRDRLERLGRGDPASAG